MRFLEVTINSGSNFKAMDPSSFTEQLDGLIRKTISSSYGRKLKPGELWEEDPKTTVRLLLFEKRDHIFRQVSIFLCLRALGGGKGFEIMAHLLLLLLLLLSLLLLWLFQLLLLKVIIAVVAVVAVGIRIIIIVVVIVIIITSLSPPLPPPPSSCSCSSTTTNTNLIMMIIEIVTMIGIMRKQACESDPPKPKLAAALAKHVAGIRV